MFISRMRHIKYHCNYNSNQIRNCDKLFPSMHSLKLSRAINLNSSLESISRTQHTLLIGRFTIDHETAKRSFFKRCRRENNRGAIALFRAIKSAGNEWPVF